ncbi:MAG: hypothetical protein ACI93T_004472, partial [Porticoccaceae bacterium]
GRTRENSRQGELDHNQPAFRLDQVSASTVDADDTLARTISKICARASSGRLDQTPDSQVSCASESCPDVLTAPVFAPFAVCTSDGST